MYLVTSFAFFMVGGAMAMLIRTELARPGQQFLSQEQYNQLFTMHGTIMLLLYATPIVFGFANYILPLQIGLPDVAFLLLVVSVRRHHGNQFFRHARGSRRLRLVRLRAFEPAGQLSRARTESVDY